MGSVQAYTNLVAYISCCVYGDYKEYIFIFVCSCQKMIVEQLFIACSDAMSTSQPTKPLAANLSRNFTYVKEIAMCN